MRKKRSNSLSNLKCFFVLKLNWKPQTKNAKNSYSFIRCFKGSANQKSSSRIISFFVSHWQCSRTTSSVKQTGNDCKRHLLYFLYMITLLALTDLQNTQWGLFVDVLSLMHKLNFVASFGVGSSSCHSS